MASREDGKCDAAWTEPALIDDWDGGAAVIYGGERSEWKRSASMKTMMAVVAVTAYPTRRRPRARATQCASVKLQHSDEHL
jgi:hypothetical protein